MKKNIKYFVFILLIIGAFLRFYNLNWGSPFYFHPDERNIADLVMKSSFSNPASLLKGTFAYGNFPVILSLILKSLFVPFFKLSKIIDPFAQAIIILRTISAIFSVLTIYVIYLCGKFWSQKVALIALFLTVFSTGFIQQAHFGTYDGLAALCALTTFYFLIKFLKTKQISAYYPSLIFVALGTASKINLLVLAIFPISVLFLRFRKEKNRFRTIVKHKLLGMMILISLTVLLSPNYLNHQFWNSLFYERGLVTGTISVFYTQSFYNTTPIIFQLFHVLPFLINPLLTIIFIPSFFYNVFIGIRTKNSYYLLLTTYYLLLFLPQAFLFAKWTRYMMPTITFIYLIIAITIAEIWQTKVLSIKYLVFSILTFTCVLFGVSYFITAFVNLDTRISAAKFAQAKIAPNTTILTEPYDLGIIPFNSSITTINTFNFYGLDSNNTVLDKELTTAISQSNYIILPSQRILRSRLLNKTGFPKGHQFYSDLLDGKLGYQKIYDTPCDIFCRITYLNNPVFGFEETAGVFDRPTVFIFKKK